jgi:hypothetical protein
MFNERSLGVMVAANASVTVGCLRQRGVRTVPSLNSFGSACWKIDTPASQQRERQDVDL